MVSRSRILLTTAFLLWIAFVLAAYYAVQKPIMPWDANDLEGWASAFEHAPTLDGIGVSLLNLATALAIGLAAMAMPGDAFCAMRASAAPARSAVKSVMRCLGSRR